MTVKTVLRTMQQYKLVSANQTLVIGVSGGTDSLALCHILVQLQTELDIRIHIASLDHGIRGIDSELDVQFVKQTAEQWNIPYTLGYADIPQLAKDNQMGIEAMARRARYDFLADVAEKQNANCVAVAHHADDQAETILMHIIRGSGINGLRGMDLSSPMPEHPHIMLIRPLLHLHRSDLEQYCADNQLMPRQDKTNENTDYQRNFIRHEILPSLQRINPNVVASLSRLGEIARLDVDYIQSQFEIDVRVYVQRDEHRWTIPYERFDDLHEALKRRYVIEAFSQLNNIEQGLDATHVFLAMEWYSDRRVGKLFDLGKGIRLRMGYEQLYVEDESSPIETSVYRLIPEDTDIELVIPSQIVLGDIVLRTFDDTPPDDNPLRTLILPQGLQLRIRTRRNGDRFCPQGMLGRSRKIKNWMIDHKIPGQLRGQIPLITANGAIIAIGVDHTWHLADLSQYIVNTNRKVYLALY